MSDKTKQKLWDVTHTIMFTLMLMGFGGAMIINRMEMTVRPAPQEWKTAFLVFQIIVLVMAAVLLRLMPKKGAAKKKVTYSILTSKMPTYLELESDVQL